MLNTDSQCMKVTVKRLSLLLLTFLVVASCAGQLPQQVQQQQKPDQSGRQSQSGQNEQNSALNQQLSRTVQSAAEAQASAMKDARGNNLLPGEKPLSQGISQGSGTAFKTMGMMYGKIPEGSTRGADWGKLPPKIARDLLDSQREGVSGEYREMVNLYFRAIANRARGNEGKQK